MNETKKFRKTVTMNHCNNLLLSIGLLIVSILHSNGVDAQDQYDCSFPTAVDVSSGDGSFLFRHSIHPALQVINVELEYKGAAWVGISFSQSTSMVPNVAVIGLPDDNTVLKHSLGGKVVTSVTALSSDTLMNASVTYNQTTGSTILAFTKPLVETGETTITAGSSNIILVAYGTSNTLNTHAYRASQTVTLNECVLPAGTTAAPAVAAPPTAPTPVASPPVAAPVAAPVATNNGGDVVINDLGNGLVERKLNFVQDGVSLSIVTDSVAKTLTVSMVYAGIGWLGFALSKDLFMPNSNAVMAFPTGATGAAEKWDIGDGRTNSVVTKVTDATRQQTLTDATYTQNSTHTVMTFTKPFVDGSEIPVAIDGMNNFLYAVGINNNFGYHAKRLPFAFDLSATSAGPIQSGAGSPNTKTLWMVHGILLFIAWSILVPMAVGTALLRNFLPLPKGMWFQIHRILNSIAVLCTIVGFAIAVHNINKEQGSSAKHFSTYKHHTIGLVIFIFAMVQALTGIFRPHLPKPVEATPTEHDTEDGTPKMKESSELPKKSTSRIAFEIQHRLMGTVAMIMGWFNVDSGIGLYSLRFGGRDMVAVPWAITGVIVLVTLILYIVDRLRSRKAE
jgi:Eukaryotic cytochrome b561